MINASSSTPAEEEYSDNQENYLRYLLDNTVYSDEKKKMYEQIIQCELTDSEYESLKWTFLCDKKDDITSGNQYGQKDILRHLRKLK